MTINIAIAISEGLVMAADSYSPMKDESGLTTATHASVEKITEIRGRPIAVMVNGLGELNRRTILSLIREFEFRSLESNDGVIRHATVSSLTSNLADYLRGRYNECYPPIAIAAAGQGAAPRKNGDPATEDDAAKATSNRDEVRDEVALAPSLSIVVGGYSPGIFFPEVYEIIFPGPDIIKYVPEKSNDPTGEEFIGKWGITESLDRLLSGYDAQQIYFGIRLLQQTERAKIGGAVLPGYPPPPPESLLDDLESLSGLLRFDHRLRGMPLQEAVAFAEYLGQVAIGYARFSQGDSEVGGELDVVAMQPDGLCWHRRKAFARKMAEARDNTLDSSRGEDLRRLITDFGSAMIAASPTVVSNGDPQAAQPTDDLSTTSDDQNSPRTHDL